MKLFEPFYVNGLRLDNRIVLTRNLADVAVPDSIHDVLMARIDRLPEDPKRAIQVASVIGREFALRLLRRITDLCDKVTGLVDATTYLGLGHVFAANMTGNVVLLGFALAGAGDISAAASLISLAAFLIGSAAGGALARTFETDRRRWVGMTLVFETVALCLAALSPVLALSAT